MNNGVMMQYFEWYLPDTGELWNELKRGSAELARKGITAIWIPPCTKGKGGKSDVGYAVYDLFDLGEFNQHSSERTKYGTKLELLRAIEAVKNSGMECYADVVFNHMDGGDAVETVWAQEIDWDDRNKVKSDWYQIGAWTRFSFPARNNRYSSMQWYWWCFDSLSYNEITQKADTLYRLKDKQFSS